MQSARIEGGVLAAFTFGSVLAFLAGALLIASGAYQNRKAWLLKHRGTHSFGTLEHVTRTGSDYIFEVSYADETGAAHRLSASPSRGFALRHTDGDRFSHHSIEVVFLREDPEIAALAGVSGVSVFPMIFGFAIWFLGYRSIRPRLSGRLSENFRLTRGFHRLAKNFQQPGRFLSAPKRLAQSAKNYFRERRAQGLNEQKTMWIAEREFGTTQKLWHRGREITYVIPPAIAWQVTLRFKDYGKRRREAVGDLLLRVRVDRGQDIPVPIWISERIARLGVSKKVRVGRRVFDVSVPSGILDGSVIYLPGLGRTSPWQWGMPILNRPRGRVAINVRVFPDKVHPICRPVDQMTAEELQLESWIFRRRDQIRRKLRQSSPKPELSAEHAADIFNEKGWHGLGLAIARHLAIPRGSVSLWESASLPVPGQCQTRFVNNVVRSFSISIRPEFTRDPFSTVAILAHEFCHIIETLQLSPARNAAVKPDPQTLLDIERTVDLLVFLQGLGEFQLRVARQSQLCFGYFDQKTFERIYEIASRESAQREFSRR